MQASNTLLNWVYRRGGRGQTPMHPSAGTPWRFAAILHDRHAALLELVKEMCAHPTVGSVVQHVSAVLAQRTLPSAYLVGAEGSQPCERALRMMRKLLHGHAHPERLILRLGGERTPQLVGDYNWQAASGDCGILSTRRVWGGAQRGADVKVT